jgi:drug/metabolite transporter (DMT)-like permease
VRHRLQTPVVAALGAALLFGITTPLAKLLALPAFELAGLLYLGSGIGLFAIRLLRDRGWASPGLKRSDTKWLVGSILFGGILAPSCLMLGLLRTPATAASLLLNLESLLTALLAWIVFKEHAGPRLVVGMAFIFLGGLVLSGLFSRASMTTTGAIWIVFACLGWALDNNFTRPIAGGDALFIAAIKGAIAGAVNCGVAAVIGTPMASPEKTFATLALGLAGYGVSLVLFVLALRGLGASRTGAYFASAPFIGALFALAVLHEPISAAIIFGGLLMLVGVILHLTEEHAHEHEHTAMTHVHTHVHDEHHQHTHALPWPIGQAHSHEHTHAPLRHRHSHYPDIHHQHRH